MSDVELCIDRHVAVITINRPNRANALSYDMLTSSLPHAWQTIRDNDDVRAVVVTSSPGRFFCSGMDLTDPHFAQVAIGLLATPPLLATGRQNDVWKPIVTAVDGACLGGGLMFISDSDLVVASQEATFGNPAVSNGQVAPVGPAVLARTGSFRAALRMTLLGRHEALTAIEALQADLVSEIVPTTVDPRQRATELASLIAEGPPEGVQQSLRAVWSALDLSVEMARTTAYELSAKWAREPDAARGLAAFHARYRAPEAVRPKREQKEQ